MTTSPTSDQPPREVLLTGVTGFVGKVVLEDLLHRREALGIERVNVLIRPRAGSTPQDRFEAEVLPSQAFTRLEHDWHRYVRVVPGDIARPGCGLADDDRTELARSVSHILHVAASIEFDLPLAEAVAVNTNGSLHVLEFAREVEHLQRMVAVSTAYATAHPGNGVPVLEQLAQLSRPAEELHGEILAGAADERKLLRETGHPNTYTFTKCLGELLLAERRGEVPLTILRPSIVSAAWRTPVPGWIDSRAAYGGFVMLVGGGLVRAFPARPESKVDIVPVDVVADRVLRAAFDDEHAGDLAIRYAVAGPDHSVSTGDCKDHVVGFFRRHPVAGWPDVPYYGEQGLRYRFECWWNHSVRIGVGSILSRRGWRGGRQLLGRIRTFNELFPHFTHHQYDFLATELDAHDRPDPTTYLDIINRGVHDHLFGRSVTQVPLAGRRGPSYGGDRTLVNRRRDTGLAVRCSAWLVIKALRRAANLVTFDLASFERARRDVSPGAPMVLVPTHRSYLDFVLCSLLCFARPDLGIAMPRTAVPDEFARVPVFGRLFRRLHAFYVQRDHGTVDEALSGYVGGLVRSGETIEFAVEGARSRSREFVEPRGDFLRVLQATGTSVALVPIAISYDEVPEAASFERELEGHPKEPVRFSSLVRWSIGLLLGRVRLGHVHIAAGTTVVLEEDSDVRAVGRDVMAQLQQRTCVTPFHLHAVAERTPDLGLSVNELGDAVRRRGGTVLRSPFSETSARSVQVRDTLCQQVAPWFYPEARAILGDHPVVARHLQRHDFRRADVTEAAAGDPRATAYLRALFEPCCRDFQRVVDALVLQKGLPHVDDPRELVLHAAEPLQLVNVVDAFADLEARGVLTFDGTRWTWGPLADGIERLRSAYAWFETDRACSPAR